MSLAWKGERERERERESVVVCCEEKWGVVVTEEGRESFGFGWRRGKRWRESRKTFYEEDIQIYSSEWCSKK